MATDKINREKVWSLPVRLAHWALGISVGVAWITRHGPAWLHDAAGYVALALVCVRVLSGFWGQRKNRFVGFLTSPRRTLSYAQGILAGREPRFLGHNPLGEWMIVALLTVTAGTAFTGWLFSTTMFWGVPWVVILHSVLADLLLLLIVLHIIGVVFTSVRQGENLASAMVHGWKPLSTRRHPEPPADS